MNWKRCCGIAVVAVAAWAVWGSTAHAAKRVALVIGNSNYEHAARLLNPANDSAAIGKLLQTTGFDTVDIRHDLGSVVLKRALRDFTLAARDADMAIVYFAGHGIEIGGVNYFLPIDAKLANDIDAEDEGVSLDRILRATEPARRLRLVILDACRDNPFLHNMRRSIATRAVSRGLAKVEPMTADTLVAFAAKAGSTADDGRSLNSPFTAALLRHLAEPGLDLQLAFRKVRDDVLAATGRRQEPYVYGSLGGDTISLVPPAPVVAAPPAPRPDELAWDRLKDSGNIVAIRGFVEQFPTSALRTAAEQRVATLAEMEKQQRVQEDSARRAAEIEKWQREQAEEQQRAATIERQKREQVEREKRAADRKAQESSGKQREEADRRAREKADKRAAERPARQAALNTPNSAKSNPRCEKMSDKIGCNCALESGGTAGPKGWGYTSRGMDMFVACMKRAGRR